MAKDIKVISCPNCGSVDKTVLKPDHFKCKSCQTEYFLDNDDVNINVYHHGPRISPPSPGNYTPPSRSVVGIVIGAFIFFAVFIGFLMFKNGGKNSNSNSTFSYSLPAFYFASYGFTDAAGNPVYMRMYTKMTSLDKSNNPSDYEVHALFEDPLNNKLIHDRAMFEDERRHSRYDFYFMTLPGNLVYAVCDKNRLFQVDTKSYQLADITQKLIAQFSQLSTGIAQIERLYEKDAIHILTNDGNNFYYMPQNNQLIADEKKVTEISDKNTPTPLFVFAYPSGYSGTGTKFHLYVQTPAGNDFASRELTPGRQYFDPKVIYQDGKNLVITANINAADGSPVSLQQIDVNSGNVLWALPPKKYYIQSVTKFNRGFAIEYRTDSEQDYVHGALLVSFNGKLLNDYQLKRME